MALILHYHPLSSYCHKVLIALYERGLDFEARTVDLGSPEARAAYERLWPTAKIPLLEDSGNKRIVPETSIMIEYLDSLEGPGPKLLPDDPALRLETRLWDRLFDLYVSTPMQAIVGNEIRPSDQRSAHGVESALDTLRMAYAMIDDRVTNRAWAAGDMFTMADCAAAPALFYAATLCPLPGHHPALAAYFERLMTRPSVARVITEARPYFPYYPFRAAIADRFL